MTLDTETKSRVIADNARSGSDTGSPEVQVALLNTRIKSLNEHLNLHPGDHATKRGLLILVGRQRRLLNYLRSEDVERHRALIEKLGIRR
jgi:small subunit ribosomal protein S15